MKDPFSTLGSGDETFPLEAGVFLPSALRVEGVGCRVRGLGFRI